MELALSLGSSYEALSARMTERELHVWMVYARKRMLPLQRFELYLARICMLIDTAWGGRSDAKISDYLLGMEIEDATIDEAVEVGADFGFHPRYKK
jgi:hypothetical protein